MAFGHPPAPCCTAPTSTQQEMVQNGLSGIHSVPPRTNPGPEPARQHPRFPPPVYMGLDAHRAVGDGQAAVLYTAFPLLPHFADPEAEEEE